MQESRLIFDYPLVNGHWEDVNQQYGYNSGQVDIIINSSSAQQNPRAIRYSNGYIAPQEIYRPPAVTQLPSSSYDQAIRRSSVSTNRSGAAYSTSPEPSPITRSRQPEIM